MTITLKSIQKLNESSMSRILSHIRNSTFGIVSGEVSYDTVKSLKKLGMIDAANNIGETPSDIRSWNKKATRDLKQVARGYIDVEGFWQYEKNGEVHKEKAIFVVMPSLQQMIDYAQRWYQQAFIFGDTKKISLYITDDYDKYEAEKSVDIDRAAEFLDISPYEKKTGQSTLAGGGTAIKGKAFSLIFTKDISERQIKVLESMQKHKTFIDKELKRKNISEREIVKIGPRDNRSNMIPAVICNDHLYYFRVSMLSNALSYYRGFVYKKIISS